MASVTLIYAVILWPKSEIPDRLSAVPSKIRTFAAALQGKSPFMREVAFLLRFGRADRDEGSGRWLPVWDLTEGKLRLNPPSFQDSATGRIFYLLQTAHSAEQSLLDQYGIRTASGGFYLGALELRAGMTYFYDRRPVLLPGSDNPARFLVAHPEGKIRITYSSGLTPHTLLESLPEGVVVANIEFSAPEDESARMTCQVVSSEQMRALILSPQLENDASGKFEARASWRY